MQGVDSNPMGRGSELVQLRLSTVEEGNMTLRQSSCMSLALCPQHTPLQGTMVRLTDYNDTLLCCNDVLW